MLIWNQPTWNWRVWNWYSVTFACCHGILFWKGIELSCPVGFKGKKKIIMLFFSQCHQRLNANICRISHWNGNVLLYWTVTKLTKLLCNFNNRLSENTQYSIYHFEKTKISERFFKHLRPIAHLLHRVNIVTLTKCLDLYIYLFNIHTPHAIFITNTGSPGLWHIDVKSHMKLGSMKPIQRHSCMLPWHLLVESD